MTRTNVKTKACVIGWPIEHSRSPIIHGAWLKHYGIAGAYTREAVRPDDLAHFLTTLEAQGFAGCNVTVPHKEAAFAAAEVKHDAAKAVGAANTLWIEDGKLHATNTDTYGYMAYLNHKVPDWRKTTSRVVVLGAGGAARAVIYGLIEAGCKDIVVLNRTHVRAAQLQDHFGETITAAPWSERNDAMTGVGLVVNTTSVGMSSTDQPDVDLARVDARCVVSDIVYTPLETAFLKSARECGLKTVDGLGMLLHQAVPGFEKWFGVRPTVTDELYNAVADDVRRSQCSS